MRNAIGGGIRPTAIIAAAALAAAAAAGAQGRVVTLRGVAYDSVHRAPLAGALVVLDRSRSAFSDSAGTFRFDSVPSGTILLEMSHAILDSMGLPRVVRRTDTPVDSAAVVIAGPSFDTLWRAACGERPAPADSGLIHGTVRTAAEDAGTTGAEIEVVWSEVSLSEARQLAGRRYRYATTSDANGDYSICGVPLDAAFELRAGNRTSAPVRVSLVPTGLRVLRRDLLLAPAEGERAITHGTVRGRVAHGGGGPFAGATILVDGIERATSDREGLFTVTAVPLGTRQLEVLGIGVRPQSVVIDVRPGSDARVAVTLERLTALDEVRVVASPWQQMVVRTIAERERTGIGHKLDSLQLRGAGTLRGAFGAIPGLRVLQARRPYDLRLVMKDGNGGDCVPQILIDGHPADQETLISVRPDEIGVLEVFTRAASLPVELQRGVSSCGMIVAWTKRALP